MLENLRVTVWGENIHEHRGETVKAVYPEGIHTVIASAIAEEPGVSVRCSTLQDPEHGLDEETLAGTDVLVWWGHCGHHLVEDRVVERVHKRVLEGMGLIVLHSAHFSKIFTRLMGTSCSLTHREAGEKERLWVCNPGHPITQGLGPYFEIESEEMYGEPFGIPAPDETLFISWFQGGEVFRSGCVWRRGNGKIFYFRPGHETYPTYYQSEVRQVLRNAARWAAPEGSRWMDTCRNIPAKDAPEPITGHGPKRH